jgi:elongation factor Ts
MSISAGEVKALRDKTGAGMMDCKKALAASGSNVEEAVDWLRKQGLAAASQRSGRVASDGLVGVSVHDGVGAMVEVNSETDFVARNDVFKDFVRTVAGVAAEARGDIDALRRMPYPGTDHSVDDELTQRVANIRENLTLRRTAYLATNNGAGIIGSYVHAQQEDGLGRIGVLVALDAASPSPALAELGRQLAMHVAAANPRAVSSADLDPAFVERERAILVDQAQASGKPDAVIAKMVEGRLNKFYQDVCLLQQVFVVDGESRVADVIERAAKAEGSAVAVTGFVRFALGEGVEASA